MGTPPVAAPPGSEARSVKIRPATPGDCRAFWEWRNDPGTRAVAFDPTPIPYDVHVAWFGRKLHDPATRMAVVVTADGRDIGYVRCEVADGIGEISVALAAAEQGKGVGPRALGAAAAWLLEDRAVTRLRAHVLAGNPRSRRAFERAGFVEHGPPAVVRGEEVHELTMERTR